MSCRPVRSVDRHSAHRGCLHISCPPGRGVGAGASICPLADPLSRLRCRSRPRHPAAAALRSAMMLSEGRTFLSCLPWSARGSPGCDPCGWRYGLNLLATLQCATSSTPRLRRRTRGGTALRKGFSPQRHGATEKKFRCRRRRPGELGRPIADHLTPGGSRRPLLPSGFLYHLPSPPLHPPLDPVDMAGAEVEAVGPSGTLPQRWTPRAIRQARSRRRRGSQAPRPPRSAEAALVRTRPDHTAARRRRSLLVCQALCSDHPARVDPALSSPPRSKQFRITFWRSSLIRVDAAVSVDSSGPLSAPPLRCPRARRASGAREGPGSMPTHARRGRPSPPRPVKRRGRRWRLSAPIHQRRSGPFSALAISARPLPLLLRLPRRVALWPFRHPAIRYKTSSIPPAQP